MWLWALLPICLALFGTVGIWSVFAIAVTNGSVNLTDSFPYISECGMYNPQSCLFSQICNISAVLGLWIVVIRFQQVRDFGCHGKSNIISIVLGFIACFGISVVGNFQQSVMMGAHLFGAFLTFVVGLAYFWVQLYQTYQVQPPRGCCIGPIRAICCTLSTILVISMAVLHNVSYPSVAALCEWALVMIYFCLFGLFAAEFRHVDFHRLTVQKQGLKNNPPASVIMNEFAENALS
ncbi:modulator of macroautophagy TMEM150B [Chaetodon trifascialis]|uniref:modulator of macroautophagy TMEM150B n=1 Tax=Chaetodon trifascialis TaxID=109706 RepID=UPI00399510B4